MVNGAQIMVKCLEKEGVKVVFRLSWRRHLPVL